MPQPALKISVLASDDILLNGEATDLERLDPALAEAKSSNGLVYYYREMPPADPSPKAMEVLSLVVKHQLPVTLSTKPDFSDYVDAAGVPHPRKPPAAGPLGPIPEVAPLEKIEAFFAEVRTLAARETMRGVQVVTPDRKVLVVPTLARTGAVEKMMSNLEKLIPSSTKRKIAAIGHTEAASLNRPDHPKQSAPFFALLVGFCQIGHSVWAFEGHPSALEAGCRDADVLIVDSGVRPALEKDWVDRATGVMRNANVLVFDRTNARLVVLKQVGSRTDQLEFQA